jgi:glyoxylase-like metal-dependent hydrolase (beta-lactamase superfamily II)
MVMSRDAAQQRSNPVDEDRNLARAIEQVESVRRGEKPRPVVKTFFHVSTFTASHVVHDPETRAAAIIDSVQDFEPASARTSFGFADSIVDYVRAETLTVEWLLETHAHADHLSAAAYLRERVGGTLAIGSQIRTVQKVFGKLFNEGPGFARDGSQFDELLVDGENFALGAIPVIALFVPGHTPSDMAYVVGDAAFVGDTLFMPDYGTARADFPGGDAKRLYESIRRLMRLPDETRVFLCHDYKAPNRDRFVWETTIGAERKHNVHVHDGVTEREFVEMRQRRDATLDLPHLILPSIQVNMRGGRLPEPESNSVSYLKLPLNQF